MLLFFLMIRRPPRSTQGVSSAASDVYKRQVSDNKQKGFYAKPTLFDGLKENMTIAQEEIFGPVLGVLTVKMMRKR